MKTIFLFPHSFKRIGWIALIPATILGSMVVFFNFEFEFLNSKVLSIFSGDSFLSQALGANGRRFFVMVNDNLTNELAGVLFIVAATFVAFSKEKVEDEYISKLRLDSILWATYVNYAILLLCFIFLYSFSFLTAIIVNVFTVLIIFIIRFNLLLNRAKRN